jgi:2-polyprenyl-3-methyl-5-hydroxy-6-metoxy-1,4-benzoquinol methylase
MIVKPGKKVKTIVAVFRNYFRVDLKSLSLLDVGCSTGIITSYFAHNLGQVVGI